MTGLCGSQKFDSARRLLSSVLAPWLAGPIEHIASTAVPDLPAKPIIDIMAAVRDLRLIPFGSQLRRATSKPVASATLRAILRAARNSASIFEVTEMLSINGTAKQRSLRDMHRAASGCPTIAGSRSRAFANHRRELRTELDS